MKKYIMDGGLLVEFASDGQNTMPSANDYDRD